MKTFAFIVTMLLIGCAPKQYHDHVQKTVIQPFALASEEAAAVEPNVTLSVNIITNRPMQDFRWATTNHVWFVARSYCWTAIVSYAVSPGSWFVEWNYSPVAAYPVENGFMGMRWIPVSSEIFGPGSGIINLAVPPEPSGFFRLRKI